MAEERLKKLGIEKAKTLDKDFDSIYEVYKKKATDGGNTGELRFIKTKSRVFIYVVI